MISKTTPFTTVRLSPSGDQLTLPAGFRFEDLQEVFVWREPMSGHIVLSTKPPSMSVSELLKHPLSGPRENELMPGIGDFFRNMYPAPSAAVRPRKRKQALDAAPTEASQDRVA